MPQYEEVNATEVFGELVAPLSHLESLNQQCAAVDDCVEANLLPFSGALLITQSRHVFLAPKVYLVWYVL